MAFPSHGSALKLKNVLLFLASIVVSILFAEAAVRYIDGYPMFAMPLGNPEGSATVDPAMLDKFPLAAGVDRKWFFSEPPPLPNRGKVDPEWQRMFHYIEQHNVGGMDFRPADVFKAWNSAFAGDPCKHNFLRHAPGMLYLYDPPDGEARPPYRYMPDATQPTWLVTNQMGWRGAPIEVPRGPKTIRIVFVGSSTTVGPPHLPFSYPELVGYWLNRWAESKKLGVHFEVLNAARESIVSTDNVAIVKNEVAPLRPDLVVYYEGGNQFFLQSIVDKVIPRSDAPKAPPATAVPGWLQTASRYSAIAARVRAAIGMTGPSQDGREWPKPDYKLQWPEGLDEADPDLAYPRLPVSLNLIQRDLDAMRTAVNQVGSDFAVSSFLWMVKDGMVLDPVRHKYILEQLNSSYYPFRYRDMERLAQFQNRLLAKYARTHGIPFIDTARYFPLDPDLFVDAVHTNNAWLRLQAWITFNLLLPVGEKHLADRSWPRPTDPAAPALPTITPRKITFTCQ
ncbi:MAG TPA: hypothetical protein VD858_08220 [Reyranella sp.]|nr:hypothetical protein [Reyranella sp.]